MNKQEKIGVDEAINESKQAILNLETLVKQIDDFVSNLTEDQALVFYKKFAKEYLKQKNDKHNE